jgi:hypothetical protein
MTAHTNLPFDLAYPQLRVTMLALMAAALLASCGKKPAPIDDKPVSNKVNEAIAAPLAAPASPTAAPELPPPELGVPYKDYLQARTLEKCAVAHFEDPIVAETHAVHLLMGQAFPVNMEHVFDAPKPVGKSGAKVQGAKSDAVKTPVLPPDTAEEFALRQKYRTANALAEAHTPTQAAVQSGLTDCIYASELGLIKPELIDRYLQAFVEIACLQRSMVGPDGKLDPLAHAQAAAAVFAKVNLSAAEFARIGMVFGRFPKIQAKLHTAKASSCPDPRIAEQAKATTGEWNGEMKGDRNASLHLNGTTGTVQGAVQWLGATVRYADGAAETQAVPISGSISSDKVSLFGQLGNDWVRLEGKFASDRIEGTWTAQRAGTQSFKGTFKGEKVPVAAPAAATPSQH